MKKLQSLKKLVEVIEVQPSLASGDYCAGGTNCVIGHLLKIDGITNNQLDELDSGRYDEWGGDYSIGSIIHSIVENDLKDDFVKKSLNNLGFDLESDADLLKTLQRKNDNFGLGETTQYLYEVIGEMEAVNG